MAKVVGVRFRNVGKIYYFNPKNYKVKPGDHVIVETARGVEYGKVVLAPKDVVDDQVVHPLKEVLRVLPKTMMKERSITGSVRGTLSRSARRRFASMDLR